MKRKLEDRCKIAAVFAIMGFILWGCKDDPNTTGLAILPGSDLTQVGQVVEQESNRGFTVNDVSLRTDERLYNVFGVFNDPQFGKTKADFACQIRLESFPDFGEDPQLDSLVLILLYRDVYGDTLTTQSLKVYELESPIDIDADYEQDVDLKSLTYTDPIGEYQFIPKFRLDSAQTDTIVQELVIRLDDSVAERLLAADSLDMVDNDVFSNFFKGLYIESQDMDSGGALLGIYSLATGSKMSLFYSNSSEDSLYVNYRINDNSARVGRFEHDYSGTDFAAKLDSETEQDSLIYLQTMGGLRSKIEIPFLDSWRDSVNTGINKAELIFQVDTVASDYPNFAVPSQLLFRALNEDGLEYYPTDLSISSSLYGGFFDDSDNTYRFNITRHLQQIVNGELDNYGFYLSTSLSAIQARRVVLKGATSQSGIRLEVTYVKYN